MDLWIFMLLGMLAVSTPACSQPAQHPGHGYWRTTTEVPTITDRADDYNYNISGDLNENGVPVFAVDQRTPTKEDLQLFGTYHQPESMKDIERINSEIMSQTRENLLQFDIWVPYNVTEYGDLEFGATLKRNAARNRGYQWPYGIVYYIIDNTFDYGSIERIRQAISQYHTYTCIQFRERTYETNYLHIYPAEGCYSSVGMQGGRQIVSLGGTCTYNIGTIIHEFMHAIGFQHEQSRTDRDNYVTIYWQNIQPGMEFNFNKFDQAAIDHLGTSYDYYSVMHYPRDAFTVAYGYETIVPRYGNPAIGNRNGFSETDIYKINQYYQCGSAQTTCSDVNSACPSWARSGYCYDQNYQNYMATNCQMSCGHCVAAPDPSPTQPTASCRDMFVRCPEWAKMDECTKSRSWMEANCQASCGRCTASPAVPCKDEHKQCPEWARNRECITNPDFMLSNCMRSCGQCNKDDPCMDNHELCSTWAQYGECKKNPAYMHTECKQSCNLCGKNSSLTPECADENGNCGLWKEEGRCETSVEFMEVMCAASCGVCDGDAAPVPENEDVDPTACGAVSNWNPMSSLAMVLACWLIRRFA